MRLPPECCEPKTPLCSRDRPMFSTFYQIQLVSTEAALCLPPLVEYNCPLLSLDLLDPVAASHGQVFLITLAFPFLISLTQDFFGRIRVPPPSLGRAFRLFFRRPVLCSWKWFAYPLLPLNRPCQRILTFSNFGCISIYPGSLPFPSNPINL